MKPFICTNLSLSDFQYLTLTFKQGKALSELKYDLFEIRKDPFHRGDFWPGVVNKVCAKVVEDLYPGQLKQVEIFRVFRTMMRNTSLAFNANPARFPETLSALSDLQTLGEQITDEGQTAFLCWRSVLLKMNSFATGAEVEDDPAVVQEKRIAAEDSKLNASRENAKKATAAKTSKRARV